VLVAISATFRSGTGWTFNHKLNNKSFNFSSSIALQLAGADTAPIPLLRQAAGRWRQCVCSSKLLALFNFLSAYYFKLKCEACMNLWSYIEALFSQKLQTIRTCRQQVCVMLYGRTESLFQQSQLWSSFVRAGRYNSNFSNKLYLQIINNQQSTGADTASIPVQT
jgi:hypothetical protein